MLKLILLLAAFATLTHSLGSDDRFLKKYALIKVSHLIIKLFAKCFAVIFNNIKRKILKQLSIQCRVS